MSYILDALKKAQAERQLGNAPTIHAPPPGYLPPAQRASRTPLLVGLGVGAVVAALGAVFLMRAPAPAVQLAAGPGAAPAAVPAAAAAPGMTPAVVPSDAPASAPTAAPAVSQPAAPPLPEALPAAPLPVPARPTEAPLPKPAPPAETPRRAAPAAVEVPPAAAPPESARPVVVGPAPAADDNIGPLAALPDAVQREIPKVAFGGYIYSPNPAERLLLVDKMLRREGEEVASGLVLERLLPKAAILNYRGYRYRVAY